MVWATAHLLLNGDSRSVLLFGWLGIWALLEIVFISRREGEWVKKPVPGWSREIRGLAISLVISDLYESRDFDCLNSPGDFQNRVIVIDPLAGIVQTVADESCIFIRFLLAVVNVAADRILHRIF